MLLLYGKDQHPLKTQGRGTEGLLASGLSGFTYAIWGGGVHGVIYTQWAQSLGPLEPAAASPRPWALGTPGLLCLREVQADTSGSSMAL